MLALKVVVGRPVHSSQRAGTSLTHTRTASNTFIITCSNKGQALAEKEVVLEQDDYSNENLVSRDEGWGWSVICTAG